jgi:hypothetical protein
MILALAYCAIPILLLVAGGILGWIVNRKRTYP